MEKRKASKKKGGRRVSSVHRVKLWEGGSHPKHKLGRKPERIKR